MAFRATLSGVQVTGSPSDRFHLLHVFDEGLVIGPSYAPSTGTVTALLATAVVAAALLGWFGWVAGNGPMMVAAVAVFAVLVSAAAVLWWRARRAVWPGPAAAGLDARQAGAVPGADFIAADRIVWVATQPRINVPGGRIPEAREGVVAHLVDGAALRLSGPDGLAATVRAIPGLVTTDPDPSLGTTVHLIKPDPPPGSTPGGNAHPRY